MRMVRCPLLSQDIDGDDLCFDIAMVAEGLSPKSEAPDEVLAIKNFKEICLACPNHIYD